MRHFEIFFVFFVSGLCFSVFHFFLSLFFSILIFSAVSATALAPLHRRVSKIVPNPNFSAVISCMLFVFAVVIPLTALVLILKGEVLSLYTSVQYWFQPGVLNVTFQWAPGHLPYDTYRRLVADIPIQSIDIADQFIGFVRTAGDFLVRQSQLILRGSIRFFFGLFIVLFTLFYFFRDGEIIVSKIAHYSLLPQYQEKILFEKIRSLMNIVFYGVLLSAFMQGVIGSVGFSLVGVQRPLLLGICIAFLSPIPYIGTALVLVPTVVLLYLTGDHMQAIFLAVWCATIMSSVDAFFKPLFIGRQANIHPLLMFLSLFGGMAVYGPSGLILGPFIALLVVTFSEMYLSSKGDI